MLRDTTVGRDWACRHRNWPMKLRRKVRILGFAAAILAVFGISAAGQHGPAKFADGHPLNVALAAELQQAIDRETPAPAAIVVVDVESGKILAARGMEVAAHRLETPGSTVKPFVLMKLLESGRLDPKKRLLCHRPLYIGSARMDCTHPEDVTQLDAMEAIAYSCNSYVAQAAVRYDPDEIVQLYRRLGFDSGSGLTDGEAAGRVERPSTREDLQLEALGHRGIEVTPLELLVAYRNLALRVRRGDLPDAAAPVLSGLDGSVEFGMAHAAHVDGMKIAGKTGTSEEPGRPQSHGFFAGYAPADKPDIAIMVYAERGRGGDAAAEAQPVLAAFAKHPRSP
jgi:cell division protein FtsI/penicillin-binding protein 2